MTTAARRRADRERQRRCRAMHRNGQASYRIVVDADVLDMLTKLHWLADGAATDPGCVASAISRLLADAARSEK